MGEMRALTVRQPWTFCIAKRFKPVENRSKPFPPALVGIPLALHASLKVDAVTGLPTAEAMDALLAAQGTPEPVLALGAAVAVVRFSASHRYLDGGCRHDRPCTAWSEAVPGVHHWPVEVIAALRDPVPCRGMLGLWRLPDDVEKLVRAQLGEDGNHAC